MQVNLFKYLWSLPLIILIQSCNVNDAKNIEGPVTYNPTFSLPIGKYTLSFEELFQNMDLKPIDTISGKDTIPKIWFENNFYSDPKGYYDTSLVADFNFNFLNSKMEIIKSVMFRINYMSELPCNSTIQLYFEGNGNIVLDSLFSEGPFLIPAADTNSEGFVENGIHRQKDVFLNKDKMDMLGQVSSLELHMRIITRRSDNEFYKFLARYIVFVQLGVRVEIETEV
jgi:hypothetical protein